MMTRVSAVTPDVVPAFQTDGNFENLTDLYISQGRIGQRPLSKACYTWHEVLRLAAIELWRRGEAESTRVMLKAGRQTVRGFLGERFGIVTGARQFWHWENWTPDRADLQEFLGALRDARSF
jgi:hypothetical protein